MQSAKILVGERMLLTLWVGGLWIIGYVVAPVLFSELEDRALAGSVAGRLFEIIAYIGLFCGSLLLLANQLRENIKRLNLQAVLLFSMLLLIVAGQFIITPMIAELRASGLTDSSTFSVLHGLAAGGYLLTSLFGLMLIVTCDAV